MKSSKRERLEAAARVRHADNRRRSLVRLLKRTGHSLEDAYARAKLANFWDSVRYDRLVAKGKL